MVINASTSFIVEAAESTKVAFPFLKTTAGVLNGGIQQAFNDGYLGIGNSAHVGSYYQNNAYGGGEYVVAAGAGTDDGGSIINFASFHLRAVFGSTIDVARFGVRADGTSNDTAAFQAGLAYVAANTSATKRLTYTCPPATMMINADYNAGGSLNLPSHATFLGNGATLKAITNGVEHYRILCFNEVTAAEIQGPLYLVGDRTTHAGVTGEWGHGLEIIAGTDCVVSDLRIRDCWGDGIIVESTGGPAWTQASNLIIRDVVCDNNRRQGISVVALNSGRIDNPVLINTNGTSPQSGIDIEPSVSFQSVRELVVTNPVTVGNAGAGITITSNDGAVLDQIVITGGRSESNYIGLHVTKDNSNCVVDGLSVLNNTLAGALLANGSMGSRFSFNVIRNSPTGIWTDGCSNATFDGALILGCGDSIKDDKSTYSTFSNIVSVDPVNSSFSVVDPTAVGGDTSFRHCISRVSASNIGVINHLRSPDAGHSVSWLDCEFDGTTTGPAVALSGSAALYTYRYLLDGTYHGNTNQGSTGQRPVMAAFDIGASYFNTTLNAPEWWNGTAWVSSAAAATPVNVTVTGDGATTVFTVAHNLALATPFLPSGITVLDPGGNILSGSSYALSAPTANNFTVTFAVAPANAAVHTFRVTA